MRLPEEMKNAYVRPAMREGRERPQTRDKVGYFSNMEQKSLYKTARRGEEAHNMATSSACGRNLSVDCATSNGCKLAAGAMTSTSAATSSRDKRCASTKTRAKCYRKCS